MSAWRRRNGNALRPLHGIESLPGQPGTAVTVWLLSGEVRKERVIQRGLQDVVPRGTRARDRTRLGEGDTPGRDVCLALPGASKGVGLRVPPAGFEPALREV